MKIYSTQRFSYLRTSRHFETGCVPLRYQYELTTPTPNAVALQFITYSSIDSTTSNRVGVFQRNGTMPFWRRNLRFNHKAVQIFIDHRKLRFVRAVFETTQHNSMLECGTSALPECLLVCGNAITSIDKSSNPYSPQWSARPGGI